MNRSVRFLAPILAFFWWPPPVSAAPLVADLSHYRINMDAQFSGSRMFLFGARNSPGDVVIVIRGPIKDFIVRKKENTGGLWVNHGRMKLYSVPDFYAVTASRPLAEIPQTAALFSRLGIGSRTLPAPPYPQASLFPLYAEAFLRLKREQGLYAEQASTVQFMGETLFKTEIDFPGNTPPGDYTAEIYLVSDGVISGMQTLPIHVAKTGLDAFLHDYAHRHPAFYGLTAVIMALGIGWIAGRLFERI